MRAHGLDAYFAKPRRDFAPLWTELCWIAGGIMVAVALGLGFALMERVL